MRELSWGLITGITVGVVIGILLALSAVFFFKLRNRKRRMLTSRSGRNSTTPMRADVMDAIDMNSVLSDSTLDQESPKRHSTEPNGRSFWLEAIKMTHPVSVCGIPRFSYKEIQKATRNFTTLIGRGAFGSVYKAHMPSGEIFAVKVLAPNSKQGEKGFQSEVLLLGRLHHRNLVNLVGYCDEKGQHILIYVYMSKGSLASHLYGQDCEPLRWHLRIIIALDVAKGLEYLHDGAIPPVVHRDIKSANILLDHTMGARVADFGLSRAEVLNGNPCNIRGTFGYLDPEYLTSRSFSKKSDVYSFGVLLFELIAGRNPQQGLLEYVELAAMNAEEQLGWEEIVDSRLNGAFDATQLNSLAALGYKCINKLSRKRPSMRDVVQAIIRIIEIGHSKRHHSKLPLPSTLEEEGSLDKQPSETPSSISEPQRRESVDSLSELSDV